MTGRSSRGLSEEWVIVRSSRGLSEEWMIVQSSRGLSEEWVIVRSSRGLSEEWMTGRSFQIKIQTGQTRIIRLLMLSFLYSVDHSGFFSLINLSPDVLLLFFGWGGGYILQGINFYASPLWLCTHMVKQFCLPFNISIIQISSNKCAC